MLVRVALRARKEKKADSKGGAFVWFTQPMTVDAARQKNSWRALIIENKGSGVEKQPFGPELLSGEPVVLCLGGEGNIGRPPTRPLSPEPVRGVGSRTSMPEAMC